MFRVLTAACLFVVCSACATDLFSFTLRGHVSAFVVADVSPVPATVDQERAAQIALEWAQWYYGTTNLDLLSIDFQTDPSRFWLIELTAGGARVYAVVLPDGKVVESVCREQL